MTDTPKRTNEEIAEAIITEPNDHMGVQRIIEALNTKDVKHAKELAAYGGCNNCFGKGYNTVSDWSVSRNRSEQNPLMRFCKCMRGVQLKKFIDVERDEAVKSYLDALKLILPLAKGYVASHNVGSNRKYINIAEALTTPQEGLETNN